MTDTTADSQAVIAQIVAVGRLYIDGRHHECGAVIDGIAHDPETAFVFLHGIVRVLVGSSNGPWEFASQDPDEPGISDVLAILRDLAAGNEQSSQLGAWLFAQSASVNPWPYVNGTLFLLAGINHFVESGRLGWPAADVVVTHQHPEGN